MRALNQRAYFEAQTIPDRQWVQWLKQFRPLDRNKLRGYRNGLCNYGLRYSVSDAGVAGCRQRVTSTRAGVIDADFWGLW